MKSKSIWTIGFGLVGILYSIAIYTQSLHMASLIDEIGHLSDKQKDLVELGQYVERASDACSSIHLNSMILGVAFLVIIGIELSSLIRRPAK
jgi:hypothetical protein